jgi:hypothetical protein
MHRLRFLREDMGMNLLIFAVLILDAVAVVMYLAK